MEPLGQSQVFQYLKRLSRDHEIILVTYEKKHDWIDKVRRMALTREIRKLEIRWIPLRYHKRPTTLATMYDLLVGFVVGLFLCVRYRIQIIHARGYVISVLGLGLKCVLGRKLIFDTRSFWPDERVDLGLWSKSSLVYRVAKWLEYRLLIESDVAVALNQEAVDLMQEYPCFQGRSKRFAVIPTCTNLELFRPVLDRKVHLDQGDNRQFTLGYVGSARSCYLFDSVLECFIALKQRRPNARMLIINRNDHSHIRERLQAYGIGMDSVEIKAVDHRDVPHEIGRMHVGIYLIAPHASRVSAVPTKMGEFLACGIPCLANAGVGNVKEILENDRVGVVLHGFDLQSMENAADQLLELESDPEVQDRCVSVAQRYFSLDKGVHAYDSIYRELMEKG